MEWTSWTLKRGQGKKSKSANFDAECEEYIEIYRKSMKKLSEGCDAVIVLFLLSQEIEIIHLMHFRRALIAQGKHPTAKGVQGLGQTRFIHVSRSGTLAAAFSMGCSWTKAAEPRIFDQDELVEMDSSFDTWSWKKPHGVPRPPGRGMHERHLKKLDAFLEKVDDSPSALQLVVKQRRSRLEAANPKAEEDSKVKRVYL